MKITQEYKYFFGALLLMTCAFLLPFLGVTDFNTKGEPREAIVAYTMMDTGNYVLPQNNGDEFAYKPPMFHWCIAGISKIVGGINEYTSRMPSALAGIFLALITFCFFAKRKAIHIAFLTSIVFLTTFEVQRASTNARVDMLLTLFIVLAIYQMYRWIERGLKGIPIWAILWMGLGTLTKGPVAIILPCMISTVYLFIDLSADKSNLKKYCIVLLKHVFVAIAAMVIPAIWYYAAYRQGGQQFLDLVYEENVLRFIGKMPYESHVNGPFYYFGILAAGFLPYTLLCIMSIPWNYFKKCRLSSCFKGQWWKYKWDSFVKMDAVDRFALLSIVLILLFYTIPKSKRSVYILPMYPFLAYYLAKLMNYLANYKPKYLTVYTWILRIIVCLSVLPILLSVIPYFNKIFHLTYYQFQVFTGWLGLGLVVALVIIYYTLYRLRKPIADVLYTTVVAFLWLNIVLLPPILNEQSDKPYAEKVAQIMSSHVQAGDPLTLYSYIDDKGTMMHFFTMNFYLKNKIQNFTPEAKKGLLLIGENDIRAFQKAYPQINLSLLDYYYHKSCDTHQNMMLYLFKKK